MATESKSEPCRIIGISGSLREGSYTTMALRFALAGAAVLGCATELLELRHFQLPFCDGGDEAAYPADVARLRESVRGAQGIILGTPEYHNGYSGVLKNALDLMGFEEFQGKMLGLVGVAGGAFGAHSALEGLRGVGRSLHAWVVPEQASIPEAWNVFDEAGRIKDPKLETRLREVGRQVARFAFLHSSCRSNEFLKQWEQAARNPGAE